MFRQKVSSVLAAFLACGTLPVQAHMLVENATRAQREFTQAKVIHGGKSGKDKFSGQGN